jgi:type III restriction enzyme
VKKLVRDIFCELPYWVPGVNNLKQYGRWAFAEFTEVYQIETDFEAKVEAEFNKMIEEIAKGEA